MTVPAGSSRPEGPADAPGIEEALIRSMLGFPPLPHMAAAEQERSATAGGGEPPSSLPAPFVFPTIVFSARASTFRKPRELSDFSSEPLVIAQSASKEAFPVVRRVQVDRSVQTGEPPRSVAAQTARNEPRNAAVSATLDAEAALALDAEPSAAAAAAQSHPPAVNEALVAQLEKAMQQNLLNDIFADEYSALWDEELVLDSSTASDLQEYQSFTEIKFAKDKPVSSIETHPELKSIIAVTCVTPTTVSEGIEAALSSKAKRAPIFLWSVHDTIHPALILEAPEDILSFKFMPRDPTLVVAGCANGQLVMWDLHEFRDLLSAVKKPKSGDINEMSFGAAANSSNGGGGGGHSVPVVRHTIASSIETAHRAPITEISLVPAQFQISYSGEVTKAASAGSAAAAAAASGGAGAALADAQGAEQILTTSLDGFLYMWEIPAREVIATLDLAWKPLFKAPVCCAQGARETGITRVLPRISRSLETSTLKLSRIICGTEEGHLVFADWMNLKEQADKAEAPPKGAHFTAIADMERSPMNADLFLSVGGELSAIWKEELERPLLYLPVSETYATCGRFSPTRAGVLFLGRADGFVEIWDLLQRSDAPCFARNVTSRGIVSMRIVQLPNKREQPSTYLAVGDGAGTLILLTVSRKYLKPVKNELELFNALIDRQIRKQTSVAGQDQASTTTSAAAAAATIAATPSAHVSNLNSDPPVSSQEALENMYKELEGSLLVS